MLVQLVNFNPYFSGYSYTMKKEIREKFKKLGSFNPYFSGHFYAIQMFDWIFILTVYSFNPCCSGYFYAITKHPAIYDTIMDIMFQSLFVWIICVIQIWK